MSVLLNIIGLCVFHTHPTRKWQALLIFMLSYVCSRERQDIVKEELSEAMLAKVEIADTFVQCLLRVGCYMSYLKILCCVALTKI